MKIRNINIALALALALTAGCQKDDESKGSVEPSITFSNEVQEQNATRAGIGLFNYQKSMKLYGTKTISGTKKEVFPNYRLNYLDDDKVWVYEATQDASLTGQIVKYWDHDATQYDFIAGAPYDHTDISADGKKVTIKNLERESATASSRIATAYLYSEPKTVAASDFDNTVVMKFHLALCRVKVAFIFNTAQSGAPGYVTLTDISFTPSGNYARQGDLEVDYSSGASTPVYKVTATETTTTPWDYQAITIEYPGHETPVYAEEIYYMLPHSSGATACAWTMRVGSLTSKNTAVVPADKMKWEPGHQYVYVFQLSSAETDPTIKFIECVNTAITSWTDATSSDATLYNW